MHSAPGTKVHFAAGRMATDMTIAMAKAPRGGMRNNGANRTAQPLAETGSKKDITRAPS